MILFEPFPLLALRDVILRTVIKAEAEDEDISAVMVLRFYTVEEIEDKRRKDND
jgi:hypothetical protein